MPKVMIPLALSGALLISCAGDGQTTAVPGPVGDGDATTPAKGADGATTGADDPSADAALDPPRCGPGERPSTAGSCVDADACAAHPCAAHAVCADLPAPALDDEDGRTCACSAGRDGDGYTFCSPYAHPGLLHTEEDFARMRSKVAAAAEPWLGGWKRLEARGRINTSYTARPVADLVRPGNTYSLAIIDLEWAYARALAWKITGDDAYAEAAIAILNAWSSTLVTVSGNADRFLAAGILAFQFANVGEIMRTYDGWQEADVARFRTMLTDIFYPMNHDFLTQHNGTETGCVSNYWANWDLYNLAGMLSIGVFAERDDMYEEALDYLYHGRGNGNLWHSVWYVHPGYLGQWQESGRDQGHATGGISTLGSIAQSLYNQGYDLLAEDNYRLLAGAEYVARTNLVENPDAPADQQTFYDVPFTPYGKGVGQGCSWELQSVVSDGARGISRPIWDLWYNHYVNRLGLSAPYVALAAARARPDAQSGDEFGYSTLTSSLDPIAEGARPAALVARVESDHVVLSWWGSAYATEYVVERATGDSADYAPIATLGAADDRTCTDAAVTAGSAYRYRVKARTPSGELVSDDARARVGTWPAFELTLGGPASASDGSGEGHPVTLAGGARVVDGRKGKALDLDGVDGYVSLPDSFLSDVTDFTLSTWLYLRSDTPDQVLFVSAIGSERYLRVNLRSSRANQRVRVASAPVGVLSEDGLSSSTSLPLDRWVHLAVTLRGGQGVIYIDGKNVGEGAAMGRLQLADLGKTTQNWIGRSNDPAQPRLDGMIEGFRIQRGALSAAEVAALAAP